RRIFAGQILSGRLSVGDTIMFSPSHKTTKVRTIEAWHAPAREGAIAGQSIGFTVEDQVFVERGQIVSLKEQPPVTANVVRLRIFWLASEGLREGDILTIKHGTQVTSASVRAIHTMVDTQTLRQNSGAKEVGRFSVAEITVR